MKQIAVLPAFILIASASQKVTNITQNTSFREVFSPLLGIYFKQIYVHENGS